MTSQPIRAKGDVTKLYESFLEKGQIRNYVLAAMGVFTGLRISDILLIKWDDLYDFKRKKFHLRLDILEQKTQKKKSIFLNSKLLAALTAYIDAAAPGKPLIVNEKTKQAITRTQAYRILRKAGEDLDLPERVSPHSLRKTFGYHAAKDGVPSSIIMELYNHSSWEVTRRYLGLLQDDLDEVYKNINYQEKEEIR